MITRRLLSLSLVAMCLALPRHASSQSPAQRAPIGGKDVAFTFVVNCHDWVNLSDSAATLDRLASIYEKHGVHGEFYFTAPLFFRYMQSHPLVLLHLVLGGHTISYHYRPPHPCYFRGAVTTQLEAMPLVERTYEIAFNEVRELDLSTGSYTTNWGGFFGMSWLTGITPVTVGAGQVSQSLGETLRYVLRLGGARTCVYFHESGSRQSHPLFYRAGLLERPADFSITRWSINGGGENFWWNHIQKTSTASEGDPSQRLLQTVDALPQGTLHFGHSLVHENNYYFSGTPWGPVYYQDSQKTQPKSPPFNLAATAPWAKARSQSQQDRIWSAYDDLVRTAATHPRIAVMTAKDIVGLVADDRTRELPADKVDRAAAALLAHHQANGSLPEWIDDGQELHVSLCEALLAFARVVSTTGSLATDFKVFDALGPVDLPDLGGVGAGARFGPAEQQQLAAQIVVSFESVPQLIPDRLTVGSKQINVAEALLLLAESAQDQLAGRSLRVRRAPQLSIAGTRLERTPALWSQRPATRVR